MSRSSALSTRSRARSASIGSSPRSGRSPGPASAFLVYRGAKERREALGDVVQNTAITVAGAASGAALEFLLRRAMFAAGPAGMLVAGTSMTTRAILERLLKRTDYAQFLRECNAATDQLTREFLPIDAS